MLKAQTYFSVVTLTVMMSVSSLCQAQQTSSFDHSYKGVVTGETNKNGMISKLGQPVSVQKTSNGYNYYYPNLIINISGGKDTINSITLYKENHTRDLNGIKVGDSIAKLTKLANINRQNNWVLDKKNVIIYWHNGSTIEKIVLPAEIKVQE